MGRAVNRVIAYPCPPPYPWLVGLKQCLGVLQVRGVKAFGEQAVDWGQQPVRFCTLAFLPPGRLRLMAARNSSDLACCRRAMSRA